MYEGHGKVIGRVVSALLYRFGKYDVQVSALLYRVEWYYVVSCHVRIIKPVAERREEDHLSML